MHKNTLGKSIKSLIQENKKFFLDMTSVFSLRGLQMVLSFATAYFLARALTQEQFGEYHYILGWIGILSIFGLPGLKDSLMQAISRAKEATYLKAIKLSFASALIGSLLLVSGSLYFLLEKNDSEMAIAFTICAALFPFLHGLSMWTAYGQGKERFQYLSKVQASNSMLTTTIQIGLLIIFPHNLLVPLIVIMGIPALQNIWQNTNIIKTIPHDSEEEIGNISFGIKQTLYSILSILANHIDKVLLYNFLSPELLAIYMAAQKLTEPVQSVTQDLAAMLAPKFAKLEHLSKKHDKLFFLYSFVLGIAIIAMSFTILPYIIIWIFGDQYSDSIPYCQALMCSVIVGNVATLRFRFIRSRMSIKCVRNITLGNAIIKIVCSTLFISQIGIIGAIISVFLTKIALSIQIHWNIKQYLK